MRTIIKALIHLFTDETEADRLLGPTNERLKQVTVDGLQEYSDGKARLSSGDPAFTVPRGSVASVRLVSLRVEGLPGINATFTTTAIGAPSILRQIRPTVTPGAEDESVPTGFLLETTNDLASLVLAHPGGVDPVDVYYTLIGDPEA